jgi:hypothetical protein
MMSPAPSRFRPPEPLRRARAAELERLAAALTRADPLADAVIDAFATLPPGRGFALLQRALRSGDAGPDAPSALRALLAAGDSVPPWVDWPAVERGGAVVLRAGLAGGIVLGMKSLVLGYASPGGNKPLVFSGRLQQQGGRRLAETSRFVQAVSQPGGMRRFGAGFDITVKVRVMHAQVRWLLRTGGRWRAGDWGEPINQHDMLATVLLFSVALVDGLRAIGYQVSRGEGDDVVQLWRYVGHLMGVEEPLLPISFDEGMATALLIRDTQGPPDDDSRALTAALFASRVEGAKERAKTPGERRLAQRRLAVMQAISRLLIGDQLADQLALPRSGWDRLGVALRPALGIGARLNRLPLWRKVAVMVGDLYWDSAVSAGLGGAAAEYTPPAALVGGHG